MKSVKLNGKTITFNGKPKEKIIPVTKEINTIISKNPIESLKAISVDTIKVFWSNGLSDDTTLANAKELSQKFGVKIQYPKAMELSHGKRK